MNTYLIKFESECSTSEFKNMNGVVVNHKQLPFYIRMIKFTTEPDTIIDIMCVDTGENTRCNIKDLDMKCFDDSPMEEDNNNLKAIGVNKLNVTLVDNVIENNGHHRYVVKSLSDESTLLQVNYQNGPRNVEGSIPGVLDEDLLYMIRDRLETFQNSEFACRENEMALCKVEEAIMWLNKRTNDREKRGVLGTYNK